MLVLCSILFALGVAEVALRVVGFSYLTIGRFDSVTGKSLLAGVETWNSEEGRAFVSINSDGLRDAEHALQKPPDTLRIAVLGDSYAAAVQVPVENTFWRVMADTLRHCPSLAGREVEVINFGVPGFGTAQEFLTLDHKVWKYSPDVVLLAFLTGNDIRNNSRALQRGGNQPYFVYRDGQLVLDNSFSFKPESRFMGSILGDWWFASVPRSRVLQLLVKFGDYLDRLKNSDERTARKEAQRIYEQGLDNEIYAPPEDPRWIDAWSVTEAILRMMNAQVREHDATFFVVSLSNSLQVHPDPAVRERFARSLGVADLLYADRRIQQLAARENIPFMMLAPPLQALAQESGECLHGFDNAEPCGGHWNALGHRLAGTIIAESFCRMSGRNHHP